MTLQDEYKIWLSKDVNKKGKWLKLTPEQKWFIFINQRTDRQPKVLNAKTVIQTPVGMVWSRSK